MVAITERLFGYTSHYRRKIRMMNVRKHNADNRCPSFRQMDGLNIFRVIELLHCFPTVFRFSSLTYGYPFNTLDTAATDTPASFAKSRILAIFTHSLKKTCLETRFIHYCGSCHLVYMRRGTTCFTDLLHSFCSSPLFGAGRISPCTSNNVQKQTSRKNRETILFVSTVSIGIMGSIWNVRRNEHDSILETVVLSRCRLRLAGWLRNESAGVSNKSNERTTASRLKRNVRQCAAAKRKASFFRPIGCGGE
ncbi:hypothetical protein GBL_3004 [Geobacillus kaustophilus GBlys]|uniref:Uncharacterized protein n=1 Tax=Geobacillus kaustophilus GBlys TaxID=1337888 RepID=U2X7P0_GEOKU|nr:hypothetical protein GBL_3004 [Geobacillus kaustophilus GBlys]